MPVHQRRKIYGSVFSAALAVGLLIQFMPFLLYAFFDQYIVIELGITAIYALALLIPAAVWYCFAKNDMPSLDKNRLKYPPAAIFISLGVITVAAYVNYFAVVPFSASGIFVNTESSPVIESVFDAVNFAVRSVIIAPICEEIFFRGFVPPRLTPCAYYIFADLLNVSHKRGAVHIHVRRGSAFRVDNADDGQNTPRYHHPHDKQRYIGGRDPSLAVLQSAVGRNSLLSGRFSAHLRRRDICGVHIHQENERQLALLRQKRPARA